MTDAISENAADRAIGDVDAARRRRLARALRKADLSEQDIFDLSETAAFFNLSNRMASATDMMPNREYHKAAR